MKRISPFLRARKEADLDSAMTPMIDVVFLLLVFFVWTASFQLMEYILPTQVSSQLGQEATDPVDPPPPPDFDQIVIRIGWDGNEPSWTMNNQPIGNLQEIANRLSAIADIENQALVILHPQATVPLGFVIETYDAAKSAGFPKIAFAVNPQRG
jgi:biopolymer transport protein ExbD